MRISAGNARPNDPLGCRTLFRMHASSAPTGPAARLEQWFATAPGPSRPLLVIAGPCVLEDDDTNRRIGDEVAAVCSDLGLPFVFKASFDKANRSSIRSPRGPGMAKGLAMIAAMRDRLGVPATTDIHDPAQAAPAAEAVDMLQIPAFLCRQTDLLAAAAATGRAVNVKKGQFMSVPEMRNALEKLREGGARRSMLTERGTFFGFNRLVNDFIGIGDMIELGREFGAPTCFDATHSMQLPGGDRTSTGGRPDRCAQVARAAVAVGVDALFLECHPEPSRSSSDAATIQPLGAVRPLLTSLVAIRRALATA
jgi:2-dehydro-3-deoxyphosphooctonate aldolase (KDO 8-P synthase)